ncbi:MAG: enoyl-CoA hydratase [Longimicrobiales bacterium]
MSGAGAAPPVGPDGAVHLARDGSVARITLDRPEARNAITMTMYGQLEAHLEALAAEARGGDGRPDGRPAEASSRRGETAPTAPLPPTPLRVVLLRGAGGFFAAGTDIAHFQSFAGADDGVAYEARIERVVAALEALPVPTVAVVEGAAVGGGLLLAAACDLRVCSPNARFGAPIARTVGNCLSLASTARLVAHLGPARTKAMLFLATLMDAEDARACGFVTEIVESEALDSRVDELCRRLAAHAPVTLRVSKEAVRRVTAAGAGADALPGEDLIRDAYGSRDFATGVRAFLDRETPEWEGC